jgi:hypothetical protein
MIGNLSLRVRLINWSRYRLAPVALFFAVTGIASGIYGFHIAQRDVLGITASLDIVQVLTSYEVYTVLVAYLVWATKDKKTRIVLAITGLLIQQVAFYAIFTLVGLVALPLPSITQIALSTALVSAISGAVATIGGYHVWLRIASRPVLARGRQGQSAAS